jgi:putative membrane protein
VSDHGSLQQQLTAMTASNGVSITPALTSQQQQDMNRLQKLSGQQFDQAYMQLMIQDHQTDVNHFQTEANANHSAPVRDMITRSLPVLQAHLTLAQQVGSQVNAQVATTPGSKVPVPTQNGQTTTTTSGSTSSQATGGQSGQANVRADSRFIREVEADNMLEVQLGQLAQSKAQNSAVKQFAQQVVSDHQKQQNEWSSMASSNGQQIKAGMGKNHKAKLNKLKNLSGQNFDRAFMTMMVQDHKDYIDYFEKEGRSAHSTQVRQLVERDLPTLRSHFTQAKQIGAQVGANTSATLRSERASSSK